MFWGRFPSHRSRKHNRRRSSTMPRGNRDGGCAREGQLMVSVAVGGDWVTGFNAQRQSTSGVWVPEGGGDWRGGTTRTPSCDGATDRSLPFVDPTMSGRAAPVSAPRPHGPAQFGCRNRKLQRFMAWGFNFVSVSGVFFLWIALNIGSDCY